MKSCKIEGYLSVSFFWRIIAVNISYSLNKSNFLFTFNPVLPKAPDFFVISKPFA